MVAGTVAAAVLVLVNTDVHAEGSKELTDFGGYRPFLEYRNNSTSNTNIRRRTIIKVFAKEGETINLGSSAVGLGNGALNWIAPDGTSGGSTDATHRITTRAQETAGPLPNAGGYTPYVIPVAQGQEGIWEIHFVSPNQANNGNPPVTAANALPAQGTSNNYVSAWDVTIRDSGGNTILGRAYTNSLAANMGGNRSGQNVLNSRLYILTKEGYRYRINMNGIDPYGFDFFANNLGLLNAEGTASYLSRPYGSGNPLFSPDSVQDPNAPDTSLRWTHKILFNPPANDWPWGQVIPAPATSGGYTWPAKDPEPPPTPSNFTFVGLDGTVGQTGTVPLGGNFRVDSDRPGSATIILDLSNDGTFGNGNDRVLSAVVAAGTNTIPWDGNDGANPAVPVPASQPPISAKLTLNTGEAHFPMLDAEHNRNGFIIERLNDPTPQTSPVPPKFEIFYNDTLLSGGSPPNPLDGSYGVDSAGGAHEWASNFGNNRAVDTWVFYPSNALDIPSSILVREADLSVTMTDGQTVIARGSPTTYTIVVHNDGPSPAPLADFSALIPADVTGVTWNAGITGGTGSLGASSGAGNSIATTVSLDPNSTATFTVNGTISATATGVLDATAQILRPNDVTDPDDPNREGLGNNGAADATTVSLSDLSLTKTTSNVSPGTGDNFFYTLELTNNGPLDTTNVTVRDILPAGVTFVSTVPPGVYNPGTGDWTVGAVNNGTSTSLQINVQRNATVGAQTNTAEVFASDRDDPDSVPNNGDPTEDDRATVTINGGTADLSLNIVPSTSTPNVGQNVTLNLTLTNGGPNTTDGVSVKNLLPSGLTFVSATPSQGAYSDSTGIWSVGTVTNGAAPTLAITATVTDPNPINNSGQVTSSDLPDPDSTPNNSNPGEDDQDDDTLTPQQADLSLTNTINVATPNVGQNVVFTLTVTNGGPDAATNVAVTDAIPAGMSYVSDNGGGSYNSGTGTWTVGTVNNGANASIQITASVDTAGTKSYTAQVNASDQHDPDSTAGNSDPDEDDQASADLTPQLADLTLTKRVTNDNPVIGQNVVFTLTVVNNGPDGADNIEVRDLLPAGLAYVSHTLSQGSYISGTGVWDVGDLVTEGRAASLTITALFNGPGDVTNTAEVTACDQHDPDSTPNNTNPAEDDQDSVTVTRRPMITVNDVTATEGGGLTFTVTLDIAAPAAFDVDVTLSDVTATGGAAALVYPEDYDNVVATLSFAGTPGETQQFTVDTLDDSVLEASETFTVSLDASDPAVADWDTATGTITDNDNAAITVDDVTEVEGTGLQFTVSLDNAVQGAFDVDVSFADVTATGGAAALVYPEDYDNAAVSLNFAGTAGESHTFTVATLNDAVLEATETFTVSIDASNALITDSDTGTGTITDNDNAAVTVDDVSEVEGTGLQFTVTLDNAVQGAFTVGVAFADGTATGGAATLASPEDYDNAAATLNFTGTAGEAQTFTVATLDDAVLEGSETFTVSIDASNALIADSDTGTGTITDNDNAAVTVTDVTETEGNGLLFTVSLDNDVASAFTVDVTLSDVTATGGATPLAVPEDYDNVVATLNFAGTAGETQQFTVATLDDSDREADETFTVSLDASNTLVTDSDTATGTIVDDDFVADLSLTLTVSDPQPKPGDIITYTITVSNGGPDPATNVTVSNPVPSGVTFQSATPSQGAFDPVTGAWTVGAIPSGSSVTLQVIARVDLAGLITNTAQVSSSVEADPDSTPGNGVPTEDDQDEVSVLSCSTPIFVSNPVANRNPALAGEPVTFTAQATDPNGRPVTLSWNFGDGTSDTGETVTHEFTAPGTYTITVTAANDCGLSASATLDLEVNVLVPNNLEEPDRNPPEITGDWSAVGLTVTFTGFATDIEDGDLDFIIWDFGDGTFGYGLNPVHVYPAPGTYHVKLATHDSDWNWRPANLTVILTTSTSTTVLAETSAICFRSRFNFKRPNNDSLLFFCDLETPAGFKAAGQPIALDLVGYRYSGTLDARGRIKDGNARIIVRPMQGKTRLMMRVRKANLKASISSIVNADVQREIMRQRNFSITLGSRTFLAKSDLLYKSRQGKKASLSQY